MTKMKITRAPDHDLPEVSANSLWAALSLDASPSRGWWEIFEHLWNTQGGDHCVGSAYPRIRTAASLADEAIFHRASIFHMNVAGFLDASYRDEHGNPCTVTQKFVPHLARYVGYADAKLRKMQQDIDAAKLKAEAAEADLREKLRRA